jgi:hypothetical protein
MDFYDGRARYEVVDMQHYVSPIFTLASGQTYGASAHILLELLEACATVAGTRLPPPQKVDKAPWA